jgi:hypothetical protein
MFISCILSLKVCSRMSYFWLGRTFVTERKALKDVYFMHNLARTWAAGRVIFSLTRAPGQVASLQAHWCGIVVHPFLVSFILFLVGGVLSFPYSSSRKPLQLFLLCGLLGCAKMWHLFTVVIFVHVVVIVYLLHYNHYLPIFFLRFEHYVWHLSLMHLVRGGWGLGLG